MPGGGVLARFYRPGGVGVLNFLFARGVENSPIKEIAPAAGGNGQA